MGYCVSCTLPLQDQYSVDPTVATVNRIRVPIEYVVPFDFVSVQSVRVCILYQREDG